MEKAALLLRGDAYPLVAYLETEQRAQMALLM